MKAYITSLVPLDEDSVNTEGARAGRETENKGICCSRAEGLDAVDDVLGDVGACGLFVVTDDESHGGQGLAFESWGSRDEDQRGLMTG